jgi:hypothetical protein
MIKSSYIKNLTLLLYKIHSVFNEKTVNKKKIEKRKKKIPAPLPLILAIAMKSQFLLQPWSFGHALSCVFEPSTPLVPFLFSLPIRLSIPMRYVLGWRLRSSIIQRRRAQVATMNQFVYVEIQDSCT